LRREQTFYLSTRQRLLSGSTVVCRGAVDCVDYDKVLIGVDFVVKIERLARCTWNGKERQLIWSTSKGDVCTIPCDK